MGSLRFREVSTSWWSLDSNPSSGTLEFVPYIIFHSTLQLLGQIFKVLPTVIPPPPPLPHNLLPSPSSHESYSQNQVLFYKWWILNSIFCLKAEWFLLVIFLTVTNPGNQYQPPQKIQIGGTAPSRVPFCKYIICYFHVMTFLLSSLPQKALPCLNIRFSIPSQAQNKVIYGGIHSKWPPVDIWKAAHSF